MRMRFLWLAPIAALLLNGCAGIPGLLLGGLTGQPAPQAVQTATAPLARTNIDEQALRLALVGFDTVLYSVDALVSAHVLVRNSPRALTVRRFLVATRDALNAAFDIATELNSPVQTLSPAAIATKAARYRELLTEATTAFQSAKAAIRGESASVDRAFDLFERELHPLATGQAATSADVRMAIAAGHALRVTTAAEMSARAAGLAPARAG